MRRRIVTWAASWRMAVMLSSLAVIVTLAVPSFSALAKSMQGPTGQITLKGYIVPALKHAKSTGNKDRAQTLQLAIVLQPHNNSTLQGFLAQVNDPKSQNYHHYMTAPQYVQSFGRSSSDVQAIESYLKSHGLRVTSVAPNNLLIDVTGTVGAAEQAFGVTIENYTYQGRAVYAPANEPSLPASIAGMVKAIVGLDNVAVYHSHHDQAPATSSHALGGTGPNGAYTPSDLRTAYDMTPLTGTYTGSGSDIALFELDSYLASDVQQYRTTFGLGTLAADNILVDGATTTTGIDAAEVELDMEVASAVAPGARQEVYIGPNSNVGVNDLFTRIANDNTSKVVSTSWGACELQIGGAELSALDGIFQQYAAQGQAVFAAAGDTGAYDCGDTTLSVDSPADDPNVVSVGGTNLQTGTGGAYVSESTWSGPATTNAPQGVGGGGGTSLMFTMPTYQRGPNVINDYTDKVGYPSREVPDVSANADPNTGYAIYCTIGAGSLPCAGWITVGGTSAAAPLWAAIAIDTNQYLAAQSKPTLGSANAMIYQIFNHPTPYPAFHDITSGNNLYFPAETGYDMASGVGSPDVWNFARDAAAATPTDISRTWYFAEGYTGNGFTEYLTLANPNAGIATVTVKYLLNTGAPVVKTYVVNPTSRSTIVVNNEVGPNLEVSMVVTSTIGIIAERPMYFTYVGDGSKHVPGGTDVLGATALNTQFDFGYIDTTTNHDTYLTLLNQNSGSITANVSYYPQSGGAPTIIAHTFAANSRGTIKTNTDVPAGLYSVAVNLVGGPGLVERPMYLVDSVTGHTGSADVIGVQHPSTSWYFAEGYTSGTFSERYILSNPTTNVAHATVTFMRADGSTLAVPVTINPGALQIVDANGALGSGNVNNSASVTADQLIVAERFMSFDYVGPVGANQNASIPGATDVLGTTQPGYWFGFAEGYTGGMFGEYLTLENPDPTRTAYVGVTYLPSDGSGPIVQVVAVAPHSRYTINTNGIMNQTSFSVIVESGLPIVAERPMYFSYTGGLTGGSDVVGYQLY